MLPNNPEVRREKEIEEPVDIELDPVSAGFEDLDGHSLQRVSILYTTLTQGAQLSAHRANTLAPSFRACLCI